MFNPFKNIVLNMKATGPATVLSVWIIAIMMLGLFGQSEPATSALNILTIACVMKKIFHSFKKITMKTNIV